MTTISYSPIKSGKMLKEHRLKLQLASGHCFEPALYQHFTDWDRRLADLWPVENLLTQLLFFTGGSAA
ncbi:hypothetical protein HAX54_042378, partial [Datura stramonium]|nr:hypothetical protein [Datura stramonium]